MVSDFNIDCSGGLDLFTILSSAMRVGAAANSVVGPEVEAAMSPAVTMATTTMSLAAAANDGKAPDPSLSVEDQLADIFSTRQGTLESILAAVFVVHSDFDPQDTPYQSTDVTYETPQAALFGQGRWMIEHVETVMQKPLEEASKNMQKGLINALMSAYDGPYLVCIDESSDN